MQLFTDMHVGKAIPFFSSFSFLKTLLVSSNISSSPISQISLTDAPATHLSKTCFNTPEIERNHLSFIGTNKYSTQILGKIYKICTKLCKY